MPGRGGLLSENIAIIVLEDGTIERNTVQDNVTPPKWEETKRGVDKRRLAGENITALFFKGITVNDMIEILSGSGGGLFKYDIVRVWKKMRWRWLYIS